MAEPTFFTIEADYKSVVRDTELDPNFDPDLGPVSATVIFTPEVAAGDVILAVDADPRPTGFLPAPIVGRIDVDGRVKLRVDIDPEEFEPEQRLTFDDVASFPAEGDPTKIYKATDIGTWFVWNGESYVDYVPVRLLADTGLLRLDTPLQYRVDFKDVRFNGQPGIIKGFSFLAPNTDEVVNLIEVGRVPGLTGVGVTIGPRGYRTIAVPVDAEDPDTLYQWVDEDGVEVGDPVPLSDIIPEAIATAAATASADAILPGMVDANLAARAIGFVDEGGGTGHFTIGGVPVSGTLVPPGALWSSLGGKPAVIGAGATKADARDEIGAAAKLIHAAARVVCDGHSYMNGVGPGVTKGTNDMATLIASGLGLPKANRAVAGSVLFSHIGDGDDWGQVLQKEIRPNDRFAPTGGLYVVMWGINDAHALGNTTGDLAPFEQALRTAISRYRAAAVFENTDSTVALGGSGSWNAASGAISNSGAGIRFNPTSGATITITTPANFPGGTITLGFVNWDDGSGFTVTGPVELGSPALTPTPTDSAYRSPAVLRIPDVPAGGASYVFTTSDVSGGVGCAFDYWSWEPDENSCPFVVVVGQPKAIDYDQYGDEDLTDAGIEALNTVTQGVIAEFGERVIYVDTSDMDESTTYFQAGNIHPNAAGHAHIADLVLAAVDSAEATFIKADLNLAVAGSDIPGWVSYTPAIDGSGTTQGNATVLGAYRRDAESRVEFYARVTLGSTSVIGTFVEVSLPAAVVGANNGIVVFDAMVNRGAGATLYKLHCRIQSSTSKVRLCVIGADGALTNASTNAPLAWAAGDVITLGGIYRAA